MEVMKMQIGMGTMTTMITMMINQWCDDGDQKKKTKAKAFSFSLTETSQENEINGEVGIVIWFQIHRLIITFWTWGDKRIVALYF
jgi:hypothetical protein